MRSLVGSVAMQLDYSSRSHTTALFSNAVAFSSDIALGSLKAETVAVTRKCGWMASVLCSSVELLLHKWYRIYRPPSESFKQHFSEKCFHVF